MRAPALSFRAALSVVAATAAALTVAPGLAAGASAATHSTHTAHATHSKHVHKHAKHAKHVKAHGRTATVRGTYQHLVADGRGHHADLETDVVVSGNRQVKVDLRGHKPAPGSHVSLTGRVTDGSMTTTSWKNVGATSTKRSAPSGWGPGSTTGGGTNKSTGGTSATSGGTTGTSTGTTTGTSGQTTSTTTTAPAQPTLATGTAAHVDRVLVILATWTQPDSVTPDSARQQFFDDDNAWFTETSYGAYGITGDVTPWETIAGPTNGLCLSYSTQVLDQARSAALASGFDSTTYDRTVVYFPYQTNSDCSGYAGWSYQPGNVVWLNGAMNRRTTVHEQGHNLGLSHAHSSICQDATGAYVAYAASCSTNEYGD
ncbi:MAG TPA: hypothetical protein VFJ98_03495, partial [Mycobacteriales bacterium]|nr:hypothetical protein [Mycobacteriales bacterium]